MSEPIPVAVLSYDPEAPEDCEMTVQISETAAGFLATLSDFELKVFAAEAALRVRRALESQTTGCSTDSRAFL